MQQTTKYTKNTKLRKIFFVFFVFFVVTKYSPRGQSRRGQLLLLRRLRLRNRRSCLSIVHSIVRSLVRLFSNGRAALGASRNCGPRRLNRHRVPPLSLDRESPLGGSLAQRRGV